MRGAASVRLRAHDPHDRHRGESKLFGGYINSCEEVFTLPPSLPMPSYPCRARIGEWNGFGGEELQKKDETHWALNPNEVTHYAYLSGGLENR